jgi:hypothetical protein
VSGEVLNVAGTVNCAVSSVARRADVLPGGSFDCVNYNFYGAANRQRMPTASTA